MTLFQRIAGFLIIVACGIANAEPNTSDRTTFDFALYFAPNPSADPEAKLQELLHESYSKAFTIGSPNSTGLSAIGHWVPIAQYAPPSPKAFRYVAKDLAVEVGASIAESKRVYVLSFSAPQKDLLAANHHACELVADLADSTAGIPWDNECRQIYSAKEWRKTRVETWEGDIPDARAQINLHAYRDPELVRVITLGMRKFGVPDLIIDQVPSGNMQAAGNTINACAQLLLEGRTPVNLRFGLKLAAICHSDVRASAIMNPEAGAKGEIDIRFSETKREDGDPDNPLWKIEFPGIKGETSTERELLAFATLFGSTDKIVQAKAGDKEMRQASERARKAFFAKVADFRRGFAPNERLLIKMGFKVPGGTEYMWVEVTGWQADVVEGVLANDSYYDKALVEGKLVTVKLDDVYDYIHYKPDGTQEGNETRKVLEKNDG